MPKTSNRLNLVPPYLFEAIDRKKREAIARGMDIIDFGIGDPDLPTFPYIVEAMKTAVADPSAHNYPSSAGESSYRQAAAAWYQKRFDVTLDPATEVTGLIGSKEGLAHLSLAYIDPGEVALVPSPSYPVYTMWTLMAGGEPYTLPLTAANAFLPDLESIPDSVLSKAKLLYLNYPHNPTGAIVPNTFLREAIAFAQKHQLLIVYDNAYCDMTYDGYHAPSILQFPDAKDVAIEFTSLSKGYNMTGWRIAVAAGNADAIKALRVIKSNADSGQFKAIQHAAMDAWTGPATPMDAQNAIYARRRTVLIKGLQALGWPVDLFKATFYAWIPVPAGETSASFATLLLDTCGLVTVPGSGYGTAGEGYIRMAITVPEARIVEALARMKEAGIKYRR
jgi:LL-diaminopimelate aminotransferase